MKKKFVMPEDAEMGNSYINDKYLALDGVLLSYEGKDEYLQIPGRLGDVEISKIGNGALMESNNLRRLVLPEEICDVSVEAFSKCTMLVEAHLPYTLHSIANNSFSGCSKLSDLCVYGIEISEQRYNRLCSSSSRVNGTTYIAHTFPENKIIRDILLSTGVYAAHYIQPGIKRLFTSQSTDNTAKTEKLDGFDFTGEERYITDRDAFLRLINDKSYYEADENSEKQNDAFRRTDRKALIPRTAVFTFDDSQTKIRNGNYIISAVIKIGYHYWQSKAAVRHRGKRYYVYRRNYLVDKLNDLYPNYIRKDVAVFSEDGAVCDKKEAIEVYAKYRLLSLL